MHQHTQKPQQNSSPKHGDSKTKTPNQRHQQGVHQVLRNPSLRTLTPSLVAQLQRTHGNKFVTDLVQRLDADEGPDAGIKNQIKRIVAIDVGASVDTIPTDGSFDEHWAMQLDTSELMAKIGQAFNIDIPENEAAGLTSIDAIANYVSAVAGS